MEMYDVAGLSIRDVCGQCVMLYAVRAGDASASLSKKKVGQNWLNLVKFGWI